MDKKRKRRLCTSEHEWDPDYTEHYEGDVFEHQGKRASHSALLMHVIVLNRCIAPERTRHVVLLPRREGWTWIS